MGHQQLRLPSGSGLTCIRINAVRKGRAVRGSTATLHQGAARLLLNGVTLVATPRIPYVKRAPDGELRAFLRRKQGACRRILLATLKSLGGDSP
jgi:hypothetical protein